MLSHHYGYSGPVAYGYGHQPGIPITAISHPHMGEQVPVVAMDIASDEEDAPESADKLNSLLLAAEVCRRGEEEADRVRREEEAERKTMAAAAAAKSRKRKKSTGVTGPHRKKRLKPAAEHASFLAQIAVDANLDLIDDTSALDALMRQAEELIEYNRTLETVLAASHQLFRDLLEPDRDNKAHVQVLALVENTVDKLRASRNLLAVIASKIQGESGILCRHRNKILDLIEDIPPK